MCGHCGWAAHATWQRLAVMVAAACGRSRLITVRRRFFLHLPASTLASGKSPWCQGFSEKAAQVVLHLSQRLVKAPHDREMASPALGSMIATADSLGLGSYALEVRRLLMLHCLLAAHTRSLHVQRAGVLATLPHWWQRPAQVALPAFPATGSSPGATS